MNIILDIDGTLWDTTEIVANAWNDSVYDVGLGEKMGRFITPDMLKKEFGKPMDVIVMDLFPDADNDMLQTILKSVKSFESKAISGINTDLSYPGVCDTIAKLSANNKLYIVSNCQEGYVELVMDKLSITDYISDWECFGNTGLEKTANILLLIDRNHLDPADCVYVGDTMRDYNSTKAANLRFIHAAYGFGEMSPTYDEDSIDSFSELLNLL